MPSAVDPADRLELQLLAAALLLEDGFQHEKVVRKAADLVAEGFDGDATVELAGQPVHLRGVRRSDLEPLFRSMLSEVNVSWPSMEEAGWLKARSIAELMLSGTIPPVRGASQLWGLWGACGEPGDELTEMLQLRDAWESSVGPQRADAEREILAYAPAIIAAADQHLGRVEKGGPVPNAG